MNKILKYIIISSIILCLCSYILIDEKVDVNDIDPASLAEPVQRNLENAEARTLSYAGSDYEIRPRAEYILSGLVVSENDFDDELNIDYDSESINSKDVGIIWGSNLESNDYHKVKFKSDAWFLYWRYSGPNIKFNKNEVSNTHLVASSQEIKDQIHDFLKFNERWLK